MTEPGKLTLEQIPDAAWRILEEGARRAAHAFHTPCVATIGRYGPMQRTVVLRWVDPEQRLVVCHTDRRSAKAAEITESPRMSWHFYDRAEKLQLKLHGHAVLHTDDDFADACWKRSAARSRTCYNTAYAPGQAIAEPPAAPDPVATDEHEAAARAHFAAIACRVDFIEWLYLSGAGHRRAMFEFDGPHTLASWVTP
jgi:hypothetical protein